MSFLDFSVYRELRLIGTFTKNKRVPIKRSRLYIQYMGTCIGANFYAGIDRIYCVDIRSTRVLIGLSLVPFVQLWLYLRRNDVG